MTSIEHQQTQQQYLNIEGLDSTDARAVMMKLLSALITFIHVVLFVIGLAMQLVRPFLCSLPRAVATAIVAIFLTYVSQLGILQEYAELAKAKLPASLLPST